MSLFPAYSEEEHDNKTDNYHEIESSTWLHNDSCPQGIGYMTISVDKCESLNIEETNECEKHHKTDKIKKHKEKKRSCSHDSIYHTAKDGRVTKRKKSSSSEKKKHEMSTFDTAKTYGNFDVWSNLLEKMKSVFLEECGLDIKPENAYFISTKGDKNNNYISRTSFHQRSQYKPTKSVLGIVPPRKRNVKQKRYFSKSIKKSFISEGASIRPVKNEFLSTNTDYIPLYLTFEEEAKLTNAKINQKTDETCVSATNIDEGKCSSELEYWQWKMKSYNEKLSQSPKDVSLWLEFVRMQDQAFKYIFLEESKTCRKIKDNKNLKAITERKIAILDSAIEKNVNSLDLKYERLQLGQEIWETEKLIGEWNVLVSNFSTDISVWHKYLHFNQTYFPSFNLLHSSKAFSTCTKNLVKMYSSLQCGTENIGHLLVDMTVHLASLWCQIGYMERSIAVIQALLELNFYCPEKLQNAFGWSKVNTFEAFWDSKAPRFGEPGSVGWATFMQQGVPVEFSESIIGGTKDEEDEILESKAEFSKIWINVESSRELLNWMPWQLDPDECEDPDRMVDFDCLREHLYVLNCDTEKMYLLTELLKFLLAGDSLLDNQSSIFSSLKLESLQSFVLEKEYSESDMFWFPVIGPSIHKIQCEKYFDFLCTIINQMMTLCHNEMKKNIALQLIKLYKCRSRMFSRNPTFIRRIRKEMKCLLKKPDFRTSVELFYEYGLLEEEIGCYEDAIKIYIGAMSLGITCGDMFSAASTPLLKCLKSFIKIELGNNTACGKKDLAQNLNATIATIIMQKKVALQHRKINSSDVLKAKRKLESVIRDEILILENKSTDNIFICYAIFLLVILEYLSMGFRPACILMESHIKNLENMNISNKETLYEDYLWLIEVSAKLHKLIPYCPVSRSVKREIIISALKTAPRNITFMKKYSENQSWRDLFLGFSEKNSSPVSIILRILPHIYNSRQILRENQKIGNFSIGHKIQHILKTALNSTMGKTCPLLWRLHLRIISLVEPTALQSVCYQALHNCPGAKCIYLDCIRLVPEMLKEILLLMKEKKVRIRLPLEELEILLEKEEIN